MFALIHDTFEQSQDAPVVRHVFVADSEKKAEGYFTAHMNSDRFMAECTRRGVFDGEVVCPTKQKMVRVNAKQLKALETQSLGAAMHGQMRGATPATCPPPSFWRFGTVLAVGQLSAFSTGWILKHAISMEGRYGIARDK